MFKALTISALLVGGAIAAPASAVTSYDAFTSFNGVQGSGNFVYGNFNVSTFAASFFGYGNSVYGSGSCAFTGSICLQSSAVANVPGAYKSLTPSFQFNTVNVPDDRLLLHPGGVPGDSTFIAFIAPTAGKYSFSASFSVLDLYPTGVDLYSLDATGLNPLASLSSSNLGYSFTKVATLAAGQPYIVLVSNGGVYFNDSTGVNFSATAVPEPASWALLIAGFGLTGLAMRRRAVGTAVTA